MIRRRMCGRLGGWRARGACLFGLIAWTGCADTNTESVAQQADLQQADLEQAGLEQGDLEQLDPEQADTLPAAPPQNLFRSSTGEEPAEVELRTYSLRIVNHFPSDVLVYASAGAGRVVLDTVPERDSVRIDVQVRAERLLLEVTDRAGQSLLVHDLALLPDTLNRWVAAPGPEEVRTGRL